MGMPDKIKSFGWFGAGWAVFKGGTKDPDFYPPLNDMEAQREWLGGFGAAFAETPDEEAIEALLVYGDPCGGKPVTEYLYEALADRPDLLVQLRAHGEGQASRTLH
jgi:hypothetical protein